MVKELSVFFPAYNEEENIAAVVHKALSVLPKLAEQYEVLVVNDGSRDNTKSVVQQLATADPHVRLVDHEVNKGYGEALKTGFDNARYELICFNDGDGQFDFSEIETFLPFFPEYDLVIGYRKKRVDPIHRKLNAKMYRGFIWLLFGLRVHDIDCAFKVIKKSAYEKIRPLESSGALISAELLIKSTKSKLKIKELPVSHYPRIAGTPTGANPKVILKMFTEVVKFGRMLR